MPPLTKAKSSTAFSRRLSRRHKYSDEEVTGSQQCLQEDKTRRLSQHRDRAAPSDDILDSSYKFTLFSLEKAGNDQTYCRTHFSGEGRIQSRGGFRQLSSSACRRLFVFLFSFVFLFFFLQLHLIYFSQHPERNNTKKNATC